MATVQNYFFKITYRIEGDRFNSCNSNRFLSVSADQDFLNFFRNLKFEYMRFEQLNVLTFVPPLH